MPTASRSALTSPKTLNNRLFPQAGPTRGIGRSTAQALSYISEAILKPNTWIVVIDHHGTPDRHKALMFMCKAITTELGLKYFAFEYKQNGGIARIRCDIFGE